jgi:hypothetical protein
LLEAIVVLCMQRKLIKKMETYYFPHLYSYKETKNPNFWLNLQSKILSSNNILTEKENIEYFYNGILYEKIDFIQFLIETGQNIHFKLKNNATPMHWVGSVEMAKLLIDHGVKTNEICNCFFFSGTPLEISIKSGNINLLKFYLSNGHEYGIENAKESINFLKKRNERTQKEEIIIQILSDWVLIKFLYILLKINKYIDLESIYLLSKFLIF